MKMILETNIEWHTGRRLGEPRIIGPFKNERAAKRHLARLTKGRFIIDYQYKII